LEGRTAREARKTADRDQGQEPQSNSCDPSARGVAIVAGTTLSYAAEDGSGSFDALTRLASAVERESGTTLRGLTDAAVSVP